MIGRHQVTFGAVDGGGDGTAVECGFRTGGKDGGEQDVRAVPIWYPTSRNRTTGEGRMLGDLIVGRGEATGRTSAGWQHVGAAIDGKGLVGGKDQVVLLAR